MIDKPQPPARPQPAATFVVFERQSGTILHTHLVSAAPGARIPEDDDLARFILEHAVQTSGRHAADLECLKVAPGALEPKTRYRVDVSAGKLIATGSEEAG